MTFPQTAAPTATVFSTAATAHQVLMPPVVNAGDLLPVGFVQVSSTVTTPADWNLLSNTINGSGNTLNLYYKIAVGNEGGTTVNFVTAVTRRAVAHTYRVTSWHGVTPPEVGVGVTGSSTLPNPPLLTPSWGSADTLWLAWAGIGETLTVSSYPASYTDGVDDISVGSSACGVGSARRQLADASDNPGTFTISGSGGWTAQTLAVRPAIPDVDGGSRNGGTRAILRPPRQSR